MATNQRDLTTLEYIVLGLISEEPQSGYSIISTLEIGSHRWSASPGSIYPLLKRLEKQGYIVGELEIVYETRPRKMYSLTEAGGQALDDWLGGPITEAEIAIERDVAMIKFLFAEKRLPRESVLAWLKRYQALTEKFDISRQLFYDLAIGESSLHQRLLHEQMMMELDMLRNWIELAHRRLMGEKE
jgi:DNA-binding PadR family transcriptional regulator